MVKKTARMPLGEANLSLPTFLNVDLIIWSRSDLESFAERMGNRVVVLHSGKVRTQSVLILEASPEKKDADANRHAYACFVDVRGSCTIPDKPPK